MRDMAEAAQMQALAKAAGAALAKAAGAAAVSMLALTAAWEESRAKPPTLADARREVAAWQQRREGGQS